MSYQVIVYKEVIRTELKELLRDALSQMEFLKDTMPNSLIRLIKGTPGEGTGVEIIDEYWQG